MPCADPDQTTLTDRYDAIIERWVTPDPQDVPADVIERRNAVDPRRLLASDVWPRLAGHPRGGRDRGLAAIRRFLESLAG